MPVSRNDRTFVIKEKIGAKLEDWTNVTQLYGDTAQFDFSPWYGSCDVVFIDACHEYRYVKNDTEIALKLLRSGGVVIWHDYGVWVGVTRALNELYENDPRFRTLIHVQGTALCFWANDLAR